MLGQLDAQEQCDGIGMAGLDGVDCLYGRTYTWDVVRGFVQNRSLSGQWGG